jgi:hypothetical protein
MREKTMFQSVRPMRILCVGMDRTLLDSRCAVLASQGYDARPIQFAEAEELLKTAVFDLVILSAMLSLEEEKRILAAVPGATKTLALESLVTPPDLLRKVAALFSWPIAMNGRAPGSALRPEINVLRERTEAAPKTNHWPIGPGRAPRIRRLSGLQ